MRRTERRVFINLHRMGLVVEDLAGQPESEVRRLPKIGGKSMMTIRMELARQGLQAMWTPTPPLPTGRLAEVLRREEAQQLELPPTGRIPTRAEILAGGTCPDCGNSSTQCIGGPDCAKS